MTTEFARRRREFDATVNSMQPAITLRAADASDAPAIALIWHAGWPDGHLGNVPDALLPFRDEASFSRRAAATKIADMTVAMVNGDVVGIHGGRRRRARADLRRGHAPRSRGGRRAHHRRRAPRSEQPATVVPGSPSCRATLAPGSSMSAAAGPTTGSWSTWPRAASRFRFPPGATSRRCRTHRSPLEIARSSLQHRRWGGNNDAQRSSSDVDRTASECDCMPRFA